MGFTGVESCWTADGRDAWCVVARASVLRGPDSIEGSARQDSAGDDQPKQQVAALPPEPYEQLPTARRQQHRPVEISSCIAGAWIGATSPSAALPV